MSNGIHIVKRNGSTESININKIHKVVEFACEGLAGVSSSQIEMNANLQFYDKMSTGEIQEILGEIQFLSNFLGSLGSVIDEFVIFLVISAVFGLIILFFYSRSTDEMSKQIAKLYFILLGNFAIFAVGVDAISNTMHTKCSRRSNNQDIYYGDLLIIWI